VRALPGILLCVLLQATPAPGQNATRNPGSVESATFTSDVVDGAPTDYRDAFDNTTRVVYYYSVVLDLQGQTIKHRWKLDGKLMREVAIPVQRERQAVWSKSAMQPEWTGAWTVEVVNARGTVIELDSFAYNAPL